MFCFFRSHCTVRSVFQAAPSEWENGFVLAINKRHGHWGLQNCKGRIWKMCIQLWVPFNSDFDQLNYHLYKEDTGSTLDRPYIQVLYEPVYKGGTGLVSRLQAGGLADRFLAGTTFVFLPKRLDRLWGPPSALFSRYQGSYLWGKAVRHEADHKPQSSAEVEWGYAYILHMPPWRARDITCMFKWDRWKWKILNWLVASIAQIWSSRHSIIIMNHETCWALWNVCRPELYLLLCL